MLVVQFRFPGGRYHATPWGRNVNEGVVEWPPSPYRLARALIDVCRRRRPDWDDTRLGALLASLATPVGFRLPPATTSHTRSYLSSNTKDITSKQKIFDAFVVVNRSEELLVVFDADVSDSVAEDLRDLLTELNYFGRSESWIDVRLTDDVDLESLNCLPVSADAERHGHDPVRVACLRPAADYAELPGKPIAGKGKKAKPLSWLGAVSMSTGELLKDGWSSPPAQEMIDFLRPRGALRPLPRRRKRVLESRFKVARYALHSAVLPRIADTVPFAERIRTHLMGIHRGVCGGDPDSVSPLFSGKARDGGPAEGHEHVFILPLDEDGDGRIDHLIVKSSLTFEVSELDALDRLRSVWQPKGRPDVKIVLVSLSAEGSGRPSRRWVSATPFVTGRHHRKGRGEYFEWLSGEVRLECGFHGLPEPTSVEWIDRTQGKGHQLRWMEFVRSRKNQTPLRGHGCVLTFEEEVQGPIVIGALCHFGLGVFLPVRE